MLRSAGERFPSEGEVLVCANTTATMNVSRTAASFFIIISSSDKEFVAATLRDSGHDRDLLHRTDSVGLTVATLLPRAGVMAVATAMRRSNVGERLGIAVFVGVDAVTDSRTVLHRIGEDAGNSARSDVHDIVDRPTSLRESGEIASQEAKTLVLIHLGRGNTRVEPQQIGNQARIVRSAALTDGSRVLNQGQQINTRRRRNRNSQN